jgi:hypothetical protein
MPLVGPQIEPNPSQPLDRAPDGAIESFAGVGYFFGLAGLREGEQVIDLGSGSGMDAFCAALQVGGHGRWWGSTSRPSSSPRPSGSRQARTRSKSRPSATPTYGVLHRRRRQAGRLPRGGRGPGVADRGRQAEPYEFVSPRARDASAKYGLKSVSILAVKK